MQIIKLEKYTGKVVKSIFTIAIASIIGICVIAPKASAISKPSITEQVYGAYCCDASGVRRCILQFPVPIGSSCFCYGQGYGFTCQ